MYDVATLCMVGRIYHRLRQKRKALIHLKDAEEWAFSSADWVEFAEAYHYCGKEETAYACAINAQSLIRTSGNSLQCANLWRSLANSSHKFLKETVQCLTMAEMLQPEISDWIKCGNAWVELGYIDDAKRCLDMIEINRLIPWNLIDFLVVSRRAGFGFSNDSLRHIQEKYTNASDLIMIAEAFSMIGKRKRAESILSQVETILEGNNFFDFLYCVKAWISMKRKGRARACLNRSLPFASDSLALLHLAELSNDLGDNRKTAKCINQAISLARTFRDHLECVRTCMDSNRYDLANSSLLKAQNLVQDSEGIVTCANAWLDLNRSAEAKRCLRKLPEATR